MDSTRFDALTRVLGNGRSRMPSRRTVLALLGGGFVIGVTPAAMTEARKKKKRKHRHHHKPGKGGGGLGLGSICDPGTDTCQSGLECDSPTTRHTCSSTVEGVDTWCCVPPGGKCTECDCCGDYYCAFDDDNNPTCQPNPEG